MVLLLTMLSMQSCSFLAPSQDVISASTTISKSYNDQRQYRYIKLKNNLDVVKFLIPVQIKLPHRWMFILAVIKTPRTEQGWRTF